MTTMSNLAQDLVEEILSRVPITYLRVVRSTCKRWNGLSKDPSFRKKHCFKAAEELLVITLNDDRVCLRSINLNGINNHKDSVVPSIKQIGELNQVNVVNNVDSVFYCDGLLLCLVEEEDPYLRLVVWNPYLGQTRWIKPRTTYWQSDMFGIGYDNINNNHKILKVFKKYNREVSYEIYDFSSSSWRWRVVTISVTVLFCQPSVSLKGNSYFLVEEIVQDVQVVQDVQDEELFLLCFDFTSERFGEPLRLPFHSDYIYDDIVLSAVREEQLAVLFQNRYKLEIWITTKIEPNVVLWNKFLALDTEKIIGFNYLVEHKRFFVDEEKKVAVICNIHTFKGNKDRLNETAYIVGENGYLKEMDLKEAVNPKESHGYSLCPLVCSSYVPCLVPIFASLDSSEGEEDSPDSNNDSGSMDLRGRPVKPSAKAKEMQCQATYRGRGFRGCGNRGGRGFRGRGNRGGQGFRGRGNRGGRGFKGRGNRGGRG